MFFDNASTTKIDDEIINELQRLNNDFYYNAGGLYSKGRDSRDYIDNTRLSILESLNGSVNDKIIFTTVSLRKQLYNITFNIKSQ